MSTATAQPATATTTWNIDPAHSAAEFKVKHMMISNVKGHFAKVTGTLTLDESDLSRSRVEATIDASSLETRDAQRDAHLKSADFFDVEKFPALTFQSTDIRLVKGWRTGCRRRLDHSGRHAQGGLLRGRAHATGKGSVGQHARWSIGDNQDQPQGLRPELECGARERRLSGR